MDECLISTSCVAVDLTPFACALHSNADDLVAAYYALGSHTVRSQRTLSAHNSTKQETSRKTSAKDSSL